MYQKPTSPRSIGAVIDDAINLYKATFKHVWLFGLLTVVFAIAYLLLLWPYLPRMVNPQHPFAAYQSSQLWIGYLASSLFYLWSYTAMTASAAAVADGSSLSFGEASLRGLTSLPAAIGAGLLWFLAMLIGTFLLIIPGIFLWVRLMLWMVPLSVEHAGPTEALGISWRLVGGNWWRTFVTLIVALITILVIVFAAGLVAGLLVPLLRPTAATLVIAIPAVSALTRVFTAPMLPVVLVSIYNDLRLRKGGADLAARVGGLTST